MEIHAKIVGTALAEEPEAGKKHLGARKMNQNPRRGKMKSSITTLLAGTILLFAASSQAIAATTFHRVITNGIICKPMLDSQSGLLENKAWGLLNNSTTTDVWVGCPFTQVQLTTVDPALVAIINMTNRNGFEVSGSCLFREVDIDGMVVNTYSNPFTLPPNDSSVSAALVGLEDADNSFTFTCKLMRNTFISRIFHYTVQSSP